MLRKFRVTDWLLAVSEVCAGRSWPEGGERGCVCPAVALWLEAGGLHRTGGVTIATLGPSITSPIGPQTALCRP